MTIDYEKLKYANELADKWSKENGLAMQINAYYGAINNGYQLLYKFENLGFVSIDKIIDHLQELTQENSEQKYKIGDTVWFIDCDDSIGSMVIEEIEYRHPDGVYYRDKNGDFVTPRDTLYPSREALIDAQIEYWQRMKKTEPRYKMTEFGFYDVWENKNIGSADLIKGHEVEILKPQNFDI